ncbi:hypothetical protein [Flavobacterium aquatile]|uniref:hypothetical protein n=1 Tax=Flavobacterium aquatile TaxID=245 RepID=UPI000B7069DE|nr:hypothetical protein [Flavobacterium aquatile]OXA67474.1 hypothetical protein B0A61_06540 [Flavobacterium aquatile LMG 4008 = ATCC 11947]GEC79194.1 hypothetical protein FAQ01_20640 [Flavobacterium aquatile]
MKHKSDISIVPECKNPERLQLPNNVQKPTQIIWYVENQNKSPGVFSYSDYKLDLLDFHNQEFKNILPISLTNGKIEFTIFTIWANNPKDKDGAYVTQIWKALKFY